MKKMKMTIVLMVLLMATPVYAVDYKELQVTHDALVEQLSGLNTLIRVGRAGKVSVDHVGDIEFTVAQKADLVTKYNTIKANMVILFGELP